MVAKLDAYNYELLPGAIRIHINGTNDPDVCDIMSEVHRSNGNIYVEGFRFLYLNNYRLTPSYMELDVEETA
jgi:hypothetical protein